MAGWGYVGWGSPGCRNVSLRPCPRLIVGALVPPDGTHGSLPQSGGAPGRSMVRLYGATLGVLLMGEGEMVVGVS